MSLEDDIDDRPRRDLFELAPILLAVILTLCGVGMFFFHFSAGVPAPEKPAAEPAEVTIGIGQGQTIHPGSQAPGRPPDPFVPHTHP